jgi:phosphate transport system substrate-binding protein
VRVLRIKVLTPDNSQDPFSQPLVYVYKQNPNSGVAGFLSFILGAVGKNALEASREVEAL